MIKQIIQAIILCGLLALTSHQSVLADDDPVLQLVEIERDEHSKTYEIVLNEFADVLAIELEIQIDPTVGQFAEKQLIEGGCPTADFRLLNSADNSLGTLSYAVSHLATAPCSGGVVGTFKVKCRDNKSTLLEDDVVNSHLSTVAFTTHLVADGDGLSIDHTVEEGLIRCSAVSNVALSSNQAARTSTQHIYVLASLLLILTAFFIWRKQHA
ncbi:MAG: hypothetical protein ACPG8W_21780 [Candidatus Promineifilaceae bacterium]